MIREVQNAEPSVTGLVRGIVNDLQTLIRQQFVLFKHEIKQNLHKSKQAMVLLAAGAAISAMGGVLLCFMIVHLISYFGLPLWASFGIVGGLLTLGGLILAALGYSQASRVNLIPPQTAQTLKENVQWIKSQT